ncbi:PepSY domain-containing protein [Planococcus sp. X10-3]|uniref:PepSY domain-containing protein n=1 Tax=Planococcus sp. X10-3 TaxID=3061240 RepID=UPI003BAF75EA
MKKKIVIATAAGVLAVSGLVLANTDSIGGPSPSAPNATEANTAPATNDNPAPDELIGFERASAIALAIADGTVTDIELSEDDGRQEYEVEIHDAEYEYDFDIDAFTGEVLEQDRERHDDDDDREAAAIKKGNDDKQEPKQQTATDDLISVEEATRIALDKTNGGVVEEMELESDDGFRYYDFEIENGKTEFELEINAVDGTVLKFEQDDDDDDDD